MRHVDAQILIGIHRGVVDADLVMQVWTGAAAAEANIADYVAAADVLAGGNREAGKVSEARNDAVTVLKNDRSTVPAHEVGEIHDAIRGCDDWLAHRGRDIDPGMKRAFTIEWIDAFAE